MDHGIQGEQIINYSFNRPFSDNKTAIGRVVGNPDNRISIMTVIGTLKAIPTIPQIAPQTDNEIKTTRGLKFNELPMIFGSSRFPTTI